MIQPPELKSELPVKLSNNVVTTTTKVWSILLASKNGELATVKKLVEECPELIYAQYNYTPPIHFAVREGHLDLVAYLLDNGAHDPTYKTYPFLDSLITIADERGHKQIAGMLTRYEANPSLCKFRGDNGEILYNRTSEEEEFQKSVNHNELTKATQILERHPEYTRDQSMSWSEGILMMPSNRKNHRLLELLIKYGATVPDVSKWGRAYYFKNYEIAKYLLEKGMNPNHKSWHLVTLMHDMAQEGDMAKAKLLVEYGADIDLLEEEYASTPLGLAARWGHVEMVKYLLAKGADANKSDARWSTSLQWARAKGHKEIEKILRNSGA